MPETIDTRPNIFPEGKTKLTIASVPVKRSTDTGKKYYEWKMEGLAGNEIKEFKLILWPQEMGELLRALGEDVAKEIEPEVFEWDKEAVLGKKIECTVVHVPRRKDPTKKDIRIKEIIAALPF